MYGPPRYLVGNSVPQRRPPQPHYSQWQPVPSSARHPAPSSARHPVPSRTGQPGGAFNQDSYQQVPMEIEEVEEDSDSDDETYCGVCNYTPSSRDAMALHKRGIGHVNKEILWAETGKPIPKKPQPKDPPDIKPDKSMQQQEKPQQKEEKPQQKQEPPKQQEANKEKQLEELEKQMERERAELQESLKKKTEEIILKSKQEQERRKLEQEQKQKHEKLKQEQQLAQQQHQKQQQQYGQAAQFNAQQYGQNYQSDYVSQQAYVQPMNPKPPIPASQQAYVQPLIPKPPIPASQQAYVRPLNPKPPIPAASTLQPTSSIQQRLLQHSNQKRLPVQEYDQYGTSFSSSSSNVDATAQAPTKPVVESYRTKAASDTASSFKKPVIEALSSKVPTPVVKGKDDDDEDEVDWSRCKLCDLSFNKANAYWVHVRGLAHYQKVEELSRKGHDEKALADADNDAEDRPKWQRCEFCNDDFISEVDYELHLTSQKHIVLKREHTRLTNPPPKCRVVADVCDGLDAYRCQVCDVNCNAHLSYIAHLNGKQHKKKMKRFEDLERARKLSEMKKGARHRTGDDYAPVKDHKPSSSQKRGLMVETLIDACDHPLNGMDYMTEFQREAADEEPRYTCDLCQSKMDQRQVISHLIGFKHRMKYYKKSQKNTKAETFSTTIERIEGRQKMRIKVELDPFSNMPQQHSSTLPDGSKWLEIKDRKTRPESELPGLDKIRKVKENLEKFASESENSSDSENSDDEYHRRKSKKRREHSPAERHPYGTFKPAVRADDVAFSSRGRGRDMYGHEPPYQPRYEVFGPEYGSTRDSPPSQLRYDHSHDRGFGPPAVSDHDIDLRPPRIPDQNYDRRFGPPPNPSTRDFPPSQLHYDRNHDRGFGPSAVSDHDIDLRPPRIPDQNYDRRLRPPPNPHHADHDQRSALLPTPGPPQDMHPHLPVHDSIAPPVHPDRPAPSFFPSRGPSDYQDVRAALGSVNPVLAKLDTSVLSSLLDSVTKQEAPPPRGRPGFDHPSQQYEHPGHYNSYGAAGRSGPGEAVVASSRGWKEGRHSSQPPLPQGTPPAKPPLPGEGDRNQRKQRAFSPFGRDVKQNRKSAAGKNARQAIDKVIQDLRSSEKEMSGEDKSATQQATALLASLGECVIENEKDAEIALEICNALTKSMVDFKLQGLSDKNKATTKLTSCLNKFNMTAAFVPKKNPEKKEKTSEWKPVK